MTFSTQKWNENGFTSSILRCVDGWLGATNILSFVHVIGLVDVTK